MTLSIDGLFVILSKNYIFCGKLVAFLLLVTNAQAWTNTLTYYEICRLQICDINMMQVLGQEQSFLKWRHNNG